MMRDLVLRDLVELESMAKFPLENLINKPKIVQKTFEDDKGIIGSVIVTGTVELCAIFNDKRHIRDRVKVMRQLCDILYRELHPKGYHDLHTFICDKSFADILVKHFNFEHVVGHALVRRY